MVRSLPQPPDDTRRTLGIRKSARYGRLKFAGRDVMRTRERRQHTFRRKELGTPKMQLPIAAQGIVDLAASPGERGGVKDDHVVKVTSPLGGLEIGENVVLFDRDAEAISIAVLPQLLHALCPAFYGGHLDRAMLGASQRKPPWLAKQSSTRRPRAYSATIA